MTALLMAALLGANPIQHYIGQEYLNTGGGTMVGTLTMADNKPICLGDTTCDWWLVYNSSGTQFEIWHTSCDGGGTDCEVLICGDGGDDCTLAGAFTATGGVNVNADNVKITLGAAGATDSYLHFNATDFEFYSSGSIVMLSPLEVGVIEIDPDSGAVPIINMEVSGTPADGTEESFCFSLDSNCLLTIFSLADGAGAVDTKIVSANEPVQLDTQLATSGHAAPFTCDATTEGATQYVDDTDDTAYARVCVCANLDGTGYDWRDLGDIVGTACPFY